MSRPKYDLACDPGLMSGIAFLDLDTLAFESFETTFDETFQFVFTQAARYGSDLSIVAESFVINSETHKKTFQPWSLEIIGVLRAASRAYTGRELTLQGSGAAKKIGSKARLKHLGWRKPTPDGHADDAASHLLMHCAGKNWLPADVLAQLVDI